jgi:hypothetical protein
LGTLIQVVFDIFAALGFFIILMRMSRAPKDDPRMSRGLQLLQSKISVLEDLSDRTEVQVNQLTAILEQKSREVQAKVQLAEQSVQAIRVSMERSLDVAKIFQDKIPHQEIIERQNTIKYVQAARLAHQGMSVDEIAEKTDLPKGEVEFIAKVNRDQLLFNEEQLPAWAKEITPPSTAESNENVDSNGNTTGFSGVQPTTSQMFEDNLKFEAHESIDKAAHMRAEIELAERQLLVENLSRLQFEMQNLDMQLAQKTSVRDFEAAFAVPRVETNSLQRIGDEFRKAVESAAASQPAAPERPASEMPGYGLAQIQTPIQNTHRPAMPSFSEATDFSVSPDNSRSMTEAPRETSATKKTTDPILARAMAQAKVQAALSKGLANEASAKKTATADAARMAELEAAKAVAKENARPVHIVRPAGSPRSENTVIRKVQFPKIDNP